MKKILIYNDEGVASGSFLSLYDALSDLKPCGYSIEAVHHRFFLTKQWEQDVALIAFPGGRDLPYHLNLKGNANARIKSYVKNGGRFLGICAGGYYGCASIEFEKGGELEICAPRELGFFRGKAIGPAYGNGLFSYSNEQGARVAQIEWEMGTSFIYYNGGCLFLDDEQDSATEIIARYSDLPSKPAAVIYCPFGKGAALLSGIHPEYTPNDPFLKYFINKILT